MGNRRLIEPRRDRVRWLTLAGILVVATVVAAGTLVERRGAPAAGPPGPGAWPATRGAVAAPSSHRVARYVFPVLGETSYAKDHADYPAADILAACGSTVRAVTDGVVLEVSRTDRYDAVSDDGAARGGLFVSLLGDDGVRYYGSHLRSIGAGVVKGARVSAGQPVGEVGDSGRAGACHLHFGISPPCAGAGDWWIRRGVIRPWSYLDSWRAGGHVSPSPEARAWRAVNGCPRAP